MQATLNAAALKPFIRALTCLSRYGDELVLFADAQHFTLSATNSSLSAYCRFRYGRMFFSRYRIGDGVNGPGPSTCSPREPRDVKGQLLVKTLLSIFKHRTIEKTVERCELVILESPSSDHSLDDEDTLESRLVIRLHCKHGIVKTHRLPLLIPTSLLSPGVPDSGDESRLTIGPRAIKDITEHFSSGRSMKNDPQLVWTFGDTDVDVKSLESSIDTKGRAQLATELTISADEFDVYEIAEPPITIAFHLREFNATIAFAESMASALELRFTDPAAPLFIDIEGDESDGLFVISTSQLQGTSSNSNTNTRSSSTPNLRRLSERKRQHPDNGTEQPLNVSSSGRGGSETARMEKVKKSIKAVQRTEVSEGTSVGRANFTAIKDEHMVLTPFAPDPAWAQRRHSLVYGASQNGDVGVMDRFDSGGVDGNIGDGDIEEGENRIFSRADDPLLYPPLSRIAPPAVPLTCERPVQTRRAPTPLFLPLSQLSQQDEQAIRGSGLGVEYMNPEELEAMLEGDGEEVEFDIAKDMGPGAAFSSEGDGGGCLDLIEDEFEPTQDGDRDGRKAFQPLFED